MDFDGLEVSPVRSLKSLSFSLYRVRDMCVMKKINRPGPFLKTTPRLSVRTLEVAFEQSVQFSTFYSYCSNGGLVLLCSVRTLRYKFKNPSFVHSNTAKRVLTVLYKVKPFCLIRLCAFERCIQAFECQDYFFLYKS